VVEKESDDRLMFHQDFSAEELSCEPVFFDDSSTIEERWESWVKSIDL